MRATVRDRFVSRVMVGCIWLSALAATVVLNGEPTAAQTATSPIGGVPAGSVEPVVASPTTFGTSYQTLYATEWRTFWGDTIYRNTGSPEGGIFITTVGSNNTLHIGFFDLPAGSTLTEAEAYVVDDDATDAICAILFRSDPSTGTLQEFFPETFTCSTGASTSPQTLIVPLSTIGPQAGNPTLSRYGIGVVWGQSLASTSSSLRLLGGRMGYRGPVGTPVSLPASDRFVDTRPATTRGGKSTPFVGTGGSFDFFDFTITGVAGRDGNIIPAGATAVVGNVTAIGPTANGLFKILPGGTPCTTGSSTVNFNAKFTTANAFNSGLNSSGQLRACFGSSTGAASDLLIDIVGYYVTQ